jgi:hypothetical protein
MISVMSIKFAEILGRISESQVGGRRSVGNGSSLIYVMMMNIKTVVRHQNYSGHGIKSGLMQ